MPALPVRLLAPISASVAILPPTHQINVAVNHPRSCRGGVCPTWLGTDRRTWMFQSDNSVLVALMYRRWRGIRRARRKSGCGASPYRVRLPTCSGAGMPLRVISPVIARLPHRVRMKLLASPQSGWAVMSAGRGAKISNSARSGSSSGTSWRLTPAETRWRPVASVRVDRVNPRLPRFTLLGDASDGMSNADTPNNDLLNGDPGSDFLADISGSDCSDGTWGSSNRIPQS